MLLRVLAIVLVVLLVVRLLVRLALRLAAASLRRSAPRAPYGARPTKQLARCPICGTHFEADRGLPRRAGDSPVCSEACRTAAAAGDADAGTGRAGSA